MLILGGSLCLSRSSRGDDFSWSFTDNMQEEQKETYKVSPIHIKLNPEALVDTEWVEVGDIASCIKETPECIEFLSLSLMKSPDPGKKERIGTKQIKDQLLDENANLQFGESKFEIIEITSLAQEISAEEIKASFNRLLETFSHGMENIRIKVASLTLLSPWIVRPHEFHFEFEGWSSYTDAQEIHRLVRQYRQRTKLAVKEIPIDSLNASTVRNVLVKFEFTKKVPILKDAMQRGRMISGKSISMEWRRVRSDISAYPSKIEDFDGFVLKRPMQAGNVLRFSDIKRPLTMKRGQLALMSLGSDAYVVTAKVRVKQPGRVGDIVDVVYEPTQKKLKAKIISPGLLKQVALR